MQMAERVKTKNPHAGYLCYPMIFKRQFSSILKILLGLVYSAVLCSHPNGFISLYLSLFLEGAKILPISKKHIMKKEVKYHVYCVSHVSNPPYDLYILRLTLVLRRGVRISSSFTKLYENIFIFKK